MESVGTVKLFVDINADNYLKYRNDNLFTSKPVNVVSNFGNLGFKSFSLSDAKNQISSLSVNKRETFNVLPVVEHTLREGFSLGVSSEHTSETERFRDGQVSFDLNKFKSTKLRGVPVIWISSLTIPLLWLRD